MDEQEFRRRADAALEDLHRRLAVACESHAFDADFNSGTLVVEFEDTNTKFVVSPNTPVRQVWVSAQMKSYKLDWDAAREAFVLPESRQTLTELVGAAITSEIHESVTL